MLSSRKILNYRKSAGVKVLTNIMSGFFTQHLLHARYAGGDLNLVVECGLFMCLFVLSVSLFVYLFIFLFCLFVSFWLV